MRKNIFLFAIFLLSILGITHASNALEVETHRAINEYISSNTLNNFSLSDYLNKNLGFTKGKDEVVKGSTGEQKVYKWFSDGGEYEDAPPWSLSYRRSVNHFHNPITDVGYSGIWGTGVLSGKSSTQWMLLPQNTQSPGGYYSWNDVRDYYLKALTSSAKNDRDNYFAETFRGVGQLMHLIQDVSVPAHTRDDGHLFYNYENYVESYVNNYGVPTPTGSQFFSGSISNIASFIDTNQYNGANPDVTANNNSIGLSEYTNANFFSEDTINVSNFTYPDITQTTITERNFTNTLWNTTYPRQYYLKNCCGETNSGQGYLLSTVDYLDYWRQQYPLLSPLLPKIPVLDDNVYKDYASLLIPRAVGYSAGLLNYFFRGKMDMIKDSNNPNHYIIKNLSNENMSGTFSIYYDDTSDNRYLVTSWNLSIDANSQSSSVTFTAPSSPAPKEKGKYILIFQGTFGNELGAVGANVVERLCEGQWVHSETIIHCGGYGYNGACAYIVGDKRYIKYYYYWVLLPPCTPVYGSDGNECPLADETYCGFPFSYCTYQIQTEIYRWVCL
jgi:hypothetical protein